MTRVGLIAAVALAALLPSAAGCSSGPDRAGAPSTAAAGYSGEDTFRGVFFGEGPVATALVDFGVTKASQTAETHEQALVREQVVDRIAESDPRFFERFGAEMQSGDHLRVETAMMDAKARAQTALRALGEERSGGWSLTNRCVYTSIATFAYINFVFFFVYDGPETDPSGALNRAEMIHRYTLALAH